MRRWPSTTDPIDYAFDLIQAHEGELSQRLLSFLHSRPRVKVIDRKSADPTRRVSTISFVVEGLDSDQVPPHLDAHKIGFATGISTPCG